MAVNPIRQKLYVALPKVLILGGLVSASYCQYDGMSRKIDKDSEAKIYIQSNDTNRYQELLKQDGYPRTFDWVEEAKNLENTLKLDSVAKTNYALGVQAVRDSLANANKK